MDKIRINAELFEALGDEDAKTVAKIMQESGLVEDGVELVGDSDVAAPDLSEKIYGLDFSEAAMHAVDSSDMGPEFRIRLPRIRVPSFVCRTGCDAAAAAATAKAAVLTGPALAAALAAIGAAREACRRAC